MELPGAGSYEGKRMPINDLGEGVGGTGDKWERENKNLTLTHYDAKKGLQSGLSVQIIQYSRSHSRLVT